MQRHSPPSFLSSIVLPLSVPLRKQSAPTCGVKVLASIVAVVLTVASPVTAEDWPQFRGVNASGISTSKSLPSEFSFEQQVAWKAKVGDGIGCPVIADGRVYTTAMTGDKEFSVICFELANGQEVWRHAYPTGDLPRITPPNSHASSTPALDDQRVYVYFSTIGLIALDQKTGEEAWVYQMRTPAYLMDWGAGSSPIYHDGRVIFCLDDDLAPFLLALDAEKGTVCWQTPRDEMLAGYAVPVICEANGQVDIVVSGTGKLIGYDPETGKPRWNCNSLLRTMMTSPIVHGDMIYLAVQSYGDSSRTLKYALLEWLDSNQDGKLARDETPKEFWKRFDESDLNKDALIDEKEMDTAFQHKENQAGGGNIVQAVRGGGQGNVTKTHLIWNRDTTAPSNLSSPLYSDGRIYVVKRGGLAACFDAKTGETVWEKKRIQNLGDYYASPIAADGKIYIAGRNGFVVVLKDSAEFEVLAKNDLAEEILATPAVADGKIVIRTRESVYCLSSDAAPVENTAKK